MKSTSSELVKIAWAKHQPEAELIEDLLRQEGISVVVKRAAGFDVPDFLAAGPRDIFVPSAEADRARSLLPADGLGEKSFRPNAGRLFAAIVAVVVLGALAAWLVAGVN